MEQPVLKAMVLASDGDLWIAFRGGPWDSRVLRAVETGNGWLPVLLQAGSDAPTCRYTIIREMHPGWAEYGYSGVVE